MKFDGILFDLDGTLLPMDNDRFTMGYLHCLSLAVAHLGYTEETLVPAMWKGVRSMVLNDGSRPNEEAFWETFSGILGSQCYDHIPYFDDFYRNGFHQCVEFTSPAPELAARAVALAQSKAPAVVLATNPMFPRVAVEARLGWAGVAPEDFCLITDYSNSGTCKPNPAYYGEITAKLGLDPSRCLMIGNNGEEDIAAAQAAGLSTFLLDDCLITKGEIPPTPRGGFDPLFAFLEKLEDSRSR
ncbi:MAG: HAD family hydrolase [Clostridia bacterium]|nr:HAD family hydrolase [Clostridia bacterium]